jgi:hypothetical protein
LARKEDEIIERVTSDLAALRESVTQELDFVRDAFIAKNKRVAVLQRALWEAGINPPV